MRDHHCFFFVRPFGERARLPQRFYAFVDAPTPTEHAPFSCKTYISFLLEKPVQIHAGDPEHATFLAFEFVRITLMYEELQPVDAEGELYQFPYPPGCAADRVAQQRPPEIDDAT